MVRAVSYATLCKYVAHHSCAATDLTDTTNLVYIMSSVQPTEVYNLAAQSHVKVSFDMAEYTVSRVMIVLSARDLITPVAFPG